MAALIAVGLHHAITFLLLLLPLRMVGVFAVDSPLGRDPPVQRHGTFRRG
jgi:hypothetical protein